MPTNKVKYTRWVNYNNPLDKGNAKSKLSFAEKIAIFKVKKTALPVNKETVMTQPIKTFAFKPKYPPIKMDYPCHSSILQNTADWYNVRAGFLPSPKKN